MNVVNVMSLQRKKKRHNNYGNKVFIEKDKNE
jgi:hypothetical protein